MLYYILSHISAVEARVQDLMSRNVRCRDRNNIEADDFIQGQEKTRNETQEKRKHERKKERKKETTTEKTKEKTREKRRKELKKEINRTKKDKPNKMKKERNWK